MADSNPLTKALKMALPDEIREITQAGDGFHRKAMGYDRFPGDGDILYAVKMTDYVLDK